MRPEAQQQRPELYLRIAEWVWNPFRLDLDGVKPPVHEPLVEPEDNDDDDDDNPVELGVRQSMRKQFFSRLVAVAKAENHLHGHLTPSQCSWLGAREGGFWWNYHVAQQSTRVELAISNWEKQENKAIFHRLVADREKIEAEHGGKLVWQRLDDNIVSKVGITVPGGWADEATFDATTEKARGAMKRLYGALGKRAKATRQPSA